MKTLALIAGLIGVGLILFSIRLFIGLRPESAPEAKERREEGDGEMETLTLKEISHLWTEEEETPSDENNALAGDVIEFTEVAKLWRKPPSATDEVATPPPAFAIEEIAAFYRTMVQNQRLVKGARRMVIVEILKLLDAEGTCPSVVGKGHAGGGGKVTETDAQYGAEAYSLLATIPLYRHSLAVARKFAATAGKGAMLADCLIIALGHDIGKIPSFHKKYYSTADHPVISKIVLGGIPEYASLPNRQELDAAIGNHHAITPPDELTVQLKRCDHDARAEELASFGNVGVPLMPVEQVTADADRPKTDHPLGSPVEGKFTPTTLELPSWFDADTVLSLLGEMVNRLEETPTGSRWHIVSMPNGLVFANQDALWRVIHRIGGHDPLVKLADANEEMKRNLLHTVVWELSRVKNAIATDLMGRGHYMTQTTVVTKGGKGYSVLLIPFRAEAFGALPSTLESEKPQALRQMVADIKLKIREGATCVT
ncbi:hypothetical protein A2G06_02415 [Geobacter anodireducens]|nr:hypothetical protein A2G06_02415 [Geobacter anodireducens]